LGGRFRWASLGTLVGAACVSCFALSCASTPPATGEHSSSPTTERPTAEAAKSTSAGPCPSVKRFNKTVVYVKDAYFDPARIDPKRMLIAAVQGIPQAAPQLRVELLDSSVLQLTSDKGSRSFSVARVDGLLDLCRRFSEIYDSVTGPLGVADPSAEIGFAATNGMLSTLDPRTKLLTQQWYEAATKPCPSCAAGPPIALATSRMLSSGIGYIRIASLPRLASSELERALTGLSQTDSTKAPRGVVLDLRGNQGGLLEEVVRVTSLFVEDGLVVTTVAPSRKKREEQRATRTPAAKRAPLVVLVNEDTAEGAEVVAAALKDLDRAVIVGQRTNGAGIITVLYEYGDTDGIGKAYLRITIRTMLRSQGTPIDGLGVVPDIALVPTGATPGVDAGTPDRAGARPPTEERSFAEVFYPPADTIPPRAAYVEGFVEDFPIRFAHDLLLRAPFSRRSEMLPQATALSSERR